VVYANFCRESDYEYLEKVLGVSVAGRIVICRYGSIFRAQKVQFGEARNAVGVLVYSDPADDGYTQGDEFPAGPARPSGGVQRGTYLYGQYCPGDPGPERVAKLCGNVTIMPRIPVQPISWQTAYDILANLQGPPVKSQDGWQGGLPFHYHAGPGPVQISIDQVNSFERRNGYNVLATIPGTSNETVMVGCHHDAWVFGASDPLGGIVVIEEMVRVFAKMYKRGWRPLRTLMFAGWDGEEYNLLGSTTFVDERTDFIRRNLKAYVNIDGVVGTWFPDSVILGVSASPVLKGVLDQAVANTPSPVQANVSAAVANFDFTYGVLGDGSDYCSFINRLGVPSLDIQWNSPGVGEPQYHSAYDSFYLMADVVDPQFAVHKASVTLVGLALYSLVNVTQVPLSPSFAANQYAQYKQLIIQQYPFLAALDWSSYDDAVSDLSMEADAIESMLNASTATADQIAALFAIDSLLLDDAGLPTRTYFRHLMQAPDLLNDYGAQVLPSIAYYANLGDAVSAQHQIRVVAEALRGVSESLMQVTYGDRQAVRIAVITVSCVLLVAFLVLIIGYLLKRRRAKQYELIANHGDE
jgi:N-acetylated-alpha-linked acidic dipeptidase